MVRAKIRRTQLWHGRERACPRNVGCSSCNRLALFFAREAFDAQVEAGVTLMPVRCRANCTLPGVQLGHCWLAPARCRSVSSGARAVVSHATPCGCGPFSKPAVSYAGTGKLRFYRVSWVEVPLSCHRNCRLQLWTPQAWRFVFLSQRDPFRYSSTCYLCALEETAVPIGVLTLSLFAVTTQRIVLSSLSTVSSSTGSFQ